MKNTKQKPIPIVINRMFTGDRYLDNNIGHEIINLFAADDQNNYIYFCDKGTYNTSTYALPKYSIQVRPAGVKLLEVVNIAEIDRETQKISVEGITYGTVALENIFAENEEQKTDTFVTFKATKVIKPNEPKYIAYGGNESKMPGCVECKFKVNEKLRNYIKPGDSDYVVLEQFAQNALQDAQNWTLVKDRVDDVARLDVKEHRPTPGEIYGISNLELPYSNAFRFFIEKYPQMLSGFCKRLQKMVSCQTLDEICRYFDGHVDYMLNKVEREWKNIDLLIEVDKSWVIVIENKIFSDLNGKKVGEEITQLDIYQAKIEDEYNGWNKIFVLLLPDHNDIDISKYTSWYKLYYSSVSEYLNEFKDGCNDPQLDDLAVMVEQHSAKDYNYAVMKCRFERALKRASKSSKNK